MVQVDQATRRRLNQAIRELRRIRAGDRVWWDRGPQNQAKMDRGLYWQGVFRRSLELEIETYHVFEMELEDLENIVNSYPKGHAEEKSGFGMKTKKNPWLDHVMKYKKSHPSLKLKEILIEAKKTYKK